MTTSPAGRALIEQREGRRLSAYRDSRGIWTIGVGHTGRMSPPAVTPGMTITEAQCGEMLAADLAPVEAVIDTAVKVPISQNEADALASLGFNIGAPGLRSSTVIRKLNLGDIEGAAAAFLLWNHPAALEGRRKAEQAQFLEPESATPTVAAGRARVLATMAVAAKGRAKTTQAAGAGVAVAGAATTALVAQSGSHSVALAIAGLVIVGALIDGAVALWHRGQAATLQSNAAKQTTVAVPASPAPPIAQTHLTLEPTP